jgi:hypothetical protein
VLTDPTNPRLEASASTRAGGGEGGVRKTGEMEHNMKVQAAVEESVWHPSRSFPTLDLPSAVDVEVSGPFPGLKLEYGSSSIQHVYLCSPNHVYFSKLVSS